MRRRVSVIAFASIAFILAVLFLAWHFYQPFPTGADRLLLLLPDGTRFSDPRVTVWVDAANEEGLHLVPMHESSFLRPLFGKPQCAGVILPDSIQKRASDLFIGAIHRFVAAGGKLLLVFDAGTESMGGFYAGSRSRFSDLAGVDYALYKRLGSKTIALGEVSGTIPVMNDLGVPAGKYYPLSAPSPGTSGASLAPFEVQLRRYQYGELDYPSFVTSGAYAGQVLLHSPVGVVAGYHPFGKGSVLFVNIPLGYLAGDTDGLPLHCFLKYFAERVLALPYLMPVPDGVGGLVLDWHVDSNASIEPLEEINSWALLEQGTYSIDFTAGPDVNAFGDREGLDIPHNPIIQDLIRKYVRLGDEIGSHGGWIHNYFAAHVDKDDPKTMEKFLVLNKNALEQVTGRPVVEYSAPSGNQPVWVTQWLEAHGFVAYYFTGDSGMAPTQEYRAGQRVARDIWAFPILHLDRAASFEEMATYDYSNAAVAEWLDLSTKFTADNHQVRLIYFHPPGILPYHDEVHAWMKETAELRAAGRFRWYTMVQIARFLGSRKNVRWKLTERNGQALLYAAQPQSLAHQTWWFPSSAFGGQPKVIQGSATVVRATGGWMIVAGEGKRLEVEAELGHP
ncbi:MAG: polysaccharide deacetylase family protein [Candidatus Acidiferrales bacterium]